MADCWTPRGESSSVACIAVACNAIACHLGDKWNRDTTQDCPRTGPPPYWGEEGVPPDVPVVTRSFSSGFSSGFN